jgi:segregation and condensation protein B
LQLEKADNILKILWSIGMRLVREDETLKEVVVPMEDAQSPKEAATPPPELADGPVEAPEALDPLDEADDPTPLDDVDLSVLESLLFSTHHPLTAGRLAELMELPTTRVLRRAIQAINQQYERTGRSFRVEQVAGGYQLLTLPEYGDYLKKLHQREADAKLTRAALETLAIIAYRQPILRADIESIRGVACGETIRSLMEKHLVKIAGRAEEPGRPILYGTTKRFLELFGLNSTKDLPPMEDALKPRESSEEPTDQATASASPAEPAVHSAEPVPAPTTASIEPSPDATDPGRN